MTRQRTRDSQRSKVYAWESRLGAKCAECSECYAEHLQPEFPHKFVSRYPALQTRYTLAECTDIIEEVRTDYGRPMVHVGDGRRRRSACWSPTDYSIRLPVWARTRVTVLHEVAHSLAPEGCGHGPEFMRILINLLARYADVPASESRALATAMRIKVARAAHLPTPLPRAIVKRLAAIDAERYALQTEMTRLRDRIQKLDGEAYRLRAASKAA